MDQNELQRYKEQGIEELTGAIDPNQDDWQKVVVRLIALNGEGSGDFSMLEEEMLDRFLSRPNGGCTDATVIISLLPSKRELLVNTVANCGYRVKDARKF